MLITPASSIASRPDVYDQNTAFCATELSVGIYVAARRTRRSGAVLVQDTEVPVLVL